MKHVNGFTTAALACTVLASLAPAPLAAQAGPALIAPVYPGAVAVERLADRSFASEVRAFLTKDPIQAVKAFYDREVGEMENVELSDVNRAAELRSGRSNRGAPYVYAVGLDRKQFLGALGVEISALEPRDERAPTNYDAVGPVFDKLMTGQLAEEATQEQYDSLVEEYRHLAWKFYFLTDETSDHGRELTADQVAFQGCADDATGGLSTEEIMAKMQAAYATGDFAAAQEIAEQMAGAGGIGSWDTWVDCLKKIEAEAYTTLIVIHVRS